eukprot:scaffold57770_cov28-Tisochrysis_lutea.AAC.1
MTPRACRHKLVFMGNDDVETPTALVGKKIAPIWVDEDGPMAESLDIIAKNDPEVRVGAPLFAALQRADGHRATRRLQNPARRPSGPTQGFFKPASGRTDLKAWQKSVQTLMRKLQRPRYVKVPLPEFMQKGGRDAFVNNHQMPPFEKVKVPSPEQAGKGARQRRARPPARRLLRTHRATYIAPLLRMVPLPHPAPRPSPLPAVGLER